MAPREEDALTVIENHHHRGGRHSQHVLLELHAVGQLHFGDRQAQAPRLIDESLATDGPLRGVRAGCFVAHSRCDCSFTVDVTG
jgi:hypothetical protein